MLQEGLFPRVWTGHALICLAAGAGNPDPGPDFIFHARDGSFSGCNDVILLFRFDVAEASRGKVPGLPAVSVFHSTDGGLLLLSVGRNPCR